MSDGERRFGGLRDQGRVLGWGGGSPGDLCGVPCGDLPAGSGASQTYYLGISLERYI